MDGLYRLAQVNVALLSGPIDSALLADFVGGLGSSLTGGTLSTWIAPTSEGHLPHEGRSNDVPIRPLNLN